MDDPSDSPSENVDLSRRLRVAEIPLDFFTDLLFKEQADVAIQCVHGVDDPHTRLVYIQTLAEQPVALFYFTNPAWPEVPEGEEYAVPNLYVGLQPVHLRGDPIIEQPKGPGGRLILPAKRTKSA